MRVFLSWSGERSRAIADALRGWLPSMLQAVRPYFSPDDTAKGTRWNSEIARELEASNMGLLVLTPENQNAPWLLFEAGALAKNLDRSKVCPILVGGLAPSDIKGPLAQFQASRFERDDIRRLTKMMNTELGDVSLASDVLDSVFEVWWPRLQDASRKLASHDSTATVASRTERDMLEEVLALARAAARDTGGRLPLNEAHGRDLVVGFIALAKTWLDSGMAVEIADTMDPMIQTLLELAQECYNGSPSDMRKAMNDLLALRRLLRPDNVP